jgi:hypothetical protein
MILGLEVVLQSRFLSFQHSSFCTVWKLLQNVLFNLWGMSTAEDVASTRLRCRNACDGDVTCQSFLSTTYWNTLGQQSQNGQNLVIKVVFKTLC